MNLLFNFLTCISVVFIASTAHSQATQNSKQSAPPPTISLPKQVLNISNDPRVTTNALLADKAQRQLSLIDLKSLVDGVVRETYNIDIGKNTGDKKKRDDSRTPEGIYVLLEKKAPPDIPFELYGSMAFTTNYPNYFDRYENKTGSGIWLHSVPDKVPLTRGSRGCVVLRNDDIKKIESAILPKKTFLLIDSKIKWLPAKEHQAAKEEAVKWLEQWRNQWEKQDLKAYIQNYSNDFSAPPYKKNTWFTHKSKLKEKYTYVNVKLSDANIFQVKSYFIFQFVQNYESDGHKDVGIKTLYVLKQGNSMQITREDWAPIKDETTANYNNPTSAEPMSAEAAVKN